MKRLLFVLAAPVLTLGLLAPPAGAVIVCPDGHLPVPVQNEQDVQKDRNGNGVVCRKVNSQGQFVGGPDDTTDDIV